MVAHAHIKLVSLSVFALREPLHYTSFCVMSTHAFYLLIYDTHSYVTAAALHFFPCYVYS